MEIFRTDMQYMLQEQVSYHNSLKLNDYIYNSDILCTDATCIDILVLFNIKNDLMNSVLVSYICVSACITVCTVKYIWSMFVDLQVAQNEQPSLLV
jgi:hypothetical protein